MDKDGRLVIFINGNYFGSSQKNGYRNYWGTNGNFADQVMKQLNDYKAMYIDGALGGNAPFNSAPIRSSNRTSAGYDQGVIDAPSILSQISDKNGNITETVKLITHSMGGAFAKGYVRAILEYAHKMGIKTPFIAFEADFAPYQADSQKAINDPLMGPTLQYSHNKDNVAGNKPEQGAEQKDTSKDTEQSHKLISFWQQITTLPAGHYVIVDGKIVSQ